MGSSVERCDLTSRSFAECLACSTGKASGTVPFQLLGTPEAMHSQGLAATIVLLGLFVGTALLVLVAFECGLRIGRWRSRQPDPEPPLPARMIISSVLSLVAFVLGFTFGAAANHFDARNQALDNEAVSISTAYHRADLLPEPERTTLRRLLREYIDLTAQGVVGTFYHEHAIERVRSNPRHSDG